MFGLEAKVTKMDEMDETHFPTPTFPHKELTSRENKESHKETTYMAK